MPEDEGEDSLTHTSVWLVKITDCPELFDQFIGYTLPLCNLGVAQPPDNQWAFPKVVDSVELV